MGGSKCSNQDGGAPEFEDHTNIRNKYVCFPCKRVWKSAVPKYAIQSGPVDILKNYNQQSGTKIKTFYDFCKPDDAWDNYTAVYSKHKSKCAKCSADGLYVGRNFRHCKTYREWADLECRVKAGTVNLEHDFHDYPRELNSVKTDEEKAKMWNEIHTKRLKSQKAEIEFDKMRRHN